MRSKYGPCLMMLVMLMCPFVKGQTIDTKNHTTNTTNVDIVTSTVARVTTDDHSISSGISNTVSTTTSYSAKASEEAIWKITANKELRAITPKSVTDTQLPSTNTESIHINLTNCYQCRSDVNEDCGESVPSEEYLKPCSLKEGRTYHDIVLSDNIQKGSQTYCRKVVQYLKFINNTPVTIVARECTYYHKSQDHCSTNMCQAFKITICECKYDGCNTSVKHTISRFLFLMPSILLLLFSYFPP